jgi:hypothetical protein
MSTTHGLTHVHHHRLCRAHVQHRHGHTITSPVPPVDFMATVRTFGWPFVVLGCTDLTAALKFLFAPVRFPDSALFMNPSNIRFPRPWSAESV